MMCKQSQKVEIVSSLYKGMGRSDIPPGGPLVSIYLLFVPEWPLTWPLPPPPRPTLPWIPSYSLLNEMDLQSIRRT